MKSSTNHKAHLQKLGAYLFEEVRESTVAKTYKQHNILRERTELYRDFALNLSYAVSQTYLGKEYIRTRQQRWEHFLWCYGKVLAEMESEGFSFYHNEPLFDRFWDRS